MRNRHRALVGAMLVIAISAAPVAGQGVASPSPSPTASPGPSAPGHLPTTPVRSGPHWSAVADRDVTRAGVLGHVVSLGDEAIALAAATNTRGRSRMRVLATGNGSTWQRRGAIRLTGSVADLVADGTVLYAVGWDQGAAIWRSADAGATWATAADGRPFLGGADGLPATDDGAQVLAIARGPAGLVAVGEATDPDSLARRAAVWRSMDGLTWERVVAVGASPPFRAVASDGTTYVAVGATTTAPVPPSGVDASTLRWSTDGVTWTDAALEVGSSEEIEGVMSSPGAGFLAWGSSPGDATLPAIVWTSADGRTWQRRPDDVALAGARFAAVRSLEYGALTMAVGGIPTGAYAWPALGSSWRRDSIRVRPRMCVADVASVRAILVAVGGTCGARQPRGRAWTSPLD